MTVMAMIEAVAIVAADVEAIGDVAIKVAVENNYLPPLLHKTRHWHRFWFQFRYIYFSCDDFVITSLVTTTPINSTLPPINDNVSLYP